jgi:hypothetical protein
MSLQKNPFGFTIPTPVVDITGYEESIRLILDGFMDIIRDEYGNVEFNKMINKKHDQIILMNCVKIANENLSIKVDGNSIKGIVNEGLTQIRAEVAQSLADTSEV